MIIEISFISMIIYAYVLTKVPRFFLLSQITFDFSQLFKYVQEKNAR